MDNDIVQKTVGIGNIRMRMFDEHVRTLTNARHVSDLRKNLIVKSFESSRVQVLRCSGGIKVTKGFMTILENDR